jgi:hypothetical protein
MATSAANGAGAQMYVLRPSARYGSLEAVDFPTSILRCHALPGTTPLRPAKWTPQDHRSNFESKELDPEEPESTADTVNRNVANH